MKNSEKQAWLDKRKWRVSEACEEDYSGKMRYCAHCIYCDKENGECGVPQSERERRTLCATAYNRMTR